MKEKNELDILIPVFNEDKTIIKTIKNILSVVKCNYKILVCYDYDEDPSLNDNASGFTNFAAPGANRYKIATTNIC